MSAITGSILNHLLFAYVFERYKRLGKDESGAYGYYADRVEGGRQDILNEYDYELPEFIESLMPKEVFYVGSGFGFLALHLAVRGVKVTAIEGDTRRFKGMQEISSRLSEFYPQLISNLTLVNVNFPNEKFENQDLANALLLFTNFEGTLSEAVMNLIFMEFPRYKYILLSERTFGVHKKESPDERQQFQKDIMSFLPATWRREDVPVCKKNYFALYRS